MTYQEKVKNHLSNYKRSTLKIKENGIWKINKREYPHILPEDKSFNNIISTYNVEFDIYLNDLKIKNKKLQLHSDFHHLNSSQAMCFNFFFPLYHERKLELILDFFNIKNEKINYDSVCFEKNGKDGAMNNRATSFDFYFETLSKKNFFFEIKYTENGFGKALEDITHVNKFNAVYSKYLEPLNIEFQTKKEFLKNYQICRNLIHLKEDSFVVFIYPRDNKKILKETIKAKNEILSIKYSSNFYHSTWCELFEFTKRKTLKEKKLSISLNEFNEKYLSFCL